MAISWRWLALLTLVYIVDAAGPSIVRFAKERLDYREPGLQHAAGERPATVAVFIHACVGIFKKKKPVGTNETWGYGREIMVEILEHAKSSGLLSLRDASVYVTLLGTPSDRSLATRTLEQFNSSGNVHVLMTGANLFVSELPTIKAVQLYAQRVAGTSRLLYFHTKGMRNMGKYKHDWRQYAQHFLIDRHSVCLEALRVGHATCGVQLNGEEYVGNFFWARADWVAQREMDLLAIPWNMNNRMAAEDFLLSPTVLGSNDVQQHYCLLYIQHNLYDCPTPRTLYEMLPIAAPKTKSVRPTQKVSVPMQVNTVTCPPSNQKKSSVLVDNHGERCVVSIELKS